MNVQSIASAPKNKPEEIKKITQENINTTIHPLAMGELHGKAVRKAVKDYLACGKDLNRYVKNLLQDLFNASLLEKFEIPILEELVDIVTGKSLNKTRIEGIFKQLVDSDGSTIAICIANVAYNSANSEYARTSEQIAMDVVSSDTIGCISGAAFGGLMGGLGGAVVGCFTSSSTSSASTAMSAADDIDDSPSSETENDDESKT